jgi:hypothetical protein
VGNEAELTLKGVGTGGGRRLPQRPPDQALRDTSAAAPLPCYLEGGSAVDRCESAAPQIGS